nr:hypothetical protein [uncultured Roseateles sp.]
MNHDDVRRTTALWSLSNPGMGMSLRFLCPCCNQPRQQQGGKRRRVKGIVQLVCKGCCASQDAAKAAS